MSLGREQVEKVAALARLRLDPTRLETMTAQLQQIVGYVDLLAELDTSRVEPLSHPIESANVFREDRLEPSTARAEILANAPKSDGECYLVPAVLGE